MSYRPSSKYSFELSDPQLNLTPIMGLFGVLIPVLLVLSAVYELSVSNIAAPSIGEPSQPQPEPDKPPVNLTVVISDSGYTIIAVGQPIAGSNPSGAGPTLPLIEKSVGCSRYAGTTPPPRSVNMSRSPCAPGKSLEEKTFSVYDLQGLTSKLLEIKNLFPDERRVIVQAEPTTQYEAIVDVIDASRETMAANGDLVSLFDEVMVSPAPL